MNRDFIITKEHRRFSEFAGAIRKDVTIGICHGEAGVGKTQSARRYAHWDTLEPFIHAWGPRSEADPKHYAAAHRSRTVFYTPEVLAKHRDLMRDIEFYRGKVGVLIYEHLCAIGKIPTTDVPRTIDFTELIIIDEAEMSRVKNMAGISRFERWGPSGRRSPSA
ncbi:AAA family ATPase, partial [Dermacoccus abyssi]